MRLPWLTTRRLMALVAVTAVSLVTGVEADRLVRRSQSYRQLARIAGMWEEHFDTKARGYDRIAAEREAQATRGEDSADAAARMALAGKAFEMRAWAAESRLVRDYNAKTRVLFERAAWRPWVTVPTRRIPE